MRLALLDTAVGPRLHVRTPDGGFLDLAQHASNETLATIDGVFDFGADEVEEIASTASHGAYLDLPFRPFLSRHNRIFCIGRNYRSHVDEMRRDHSDWPEVFLRLPSCVAGHCDDIVVPTFSEQVDYEGELGVVIGKRGRYIAAEDAHDAVAGYVALNDISIRDWQHRGVQWTPGKNFDGTLPVSAELVTRAEIEERELVIETRVNGELVQRGRVDEMLFDVSEQIEFLSSFVTLEPGDLIATGTPGGVGAAREPERFLRDADVVEVSIDGVGSVRNRVSFEQTFPGPSRWVKLARAGIQ